MNSGISRLQAWRGFNIEGNQLSNGIVFALILATTALIYVKYRI